jgi:hypothetical protein
MVYGTGTILCGTVALILIFNKHSCCEKISATVVEKLYNYMPSHDEFPLIFTKFLVVEIYQFHRSEIRKKLLSVLGHVHNNRRLVGTVYY